MGIMLERFLSNLQQRTSWKAEPSPGHVVWRDVSYHSTADGLPFTNRGPVIHGKDKQAVRSFL
jgi:hypothetical protein